MSVCRCRIRLSGKLAHTARWTLALWVTIGILHVAHMVCRWLSVRCTRHRRVCVAVASVALALVKRATLSGLRHTPYRRDDTEGALGVVSTVLLARATAPHHITATKQNRTLHFTHSMMSSFCSKSRYILHTVLRRN